MLKRIAILLIAFVLVGGCQKKYPDDNRRFLITPTARLCLKPWNINTYKNITSYQFVFSSGILYEDIDFLKNGTCNGGELGGGPGPYYYVLDFAGTWEFIENENKIKITHNPNHYTIWTIQELDRGSLVMSNDSIKIYFSHNIR